MAKTVVASVSISVALDTADEEIYMSVSAAAKSTKAENVGTDKEYVQQSQFKPGDTAYFIVYHHPDVQIDQIVSTYGTVALAQANRVFNQCEDLSFTKDESIKEDSDTYNESSVSNSVSSYVIQWYTNSIPVQLAPDYKTFRSQQFKIALGRVKYTTITDIYQLKLPAQIPDSTLNCPNEDSETPSFPIHVLFVGSKAP